MTKFAFMYPCGLEEEFRWIPPVRVSAQRSLMRRAPAGTVVITPRARVEISGTVHRRNFDEYEVFRDRLNGGVNLAIFTNRTLRQNLGYSADPAFNTSGVEHWIATGRTDLYAGQAAAPPGGPWRTVTVTTTAAASEDDVTLPVTGLLAGEVVLRGTTVRIGLNRYTVAVDVTADGSGAATLTLAKPLLADLASGSSLKIPGDAGLFQLTDLNEGQSRGTRHVPFDMAFEEVESGEVPGGISYAHV